MNMPRREKLLHLRLFDDEYKRIESNAKKLDMQVAPYIRLVAQNPTIVQFDYSIIADHTRAIGEACDTINRLIFTIEATNNYLPKEIETIVTLMNGIFDGENKLLQMLREQRNREYEKGRTTLKRETKNAKKADAQ